jgi:hypothetical protein
MATKTVKVHEFENHTRTCIKCRSVEITKPSTLINCCLLGAPLLRDYLSEISSKKNKIHVQSLKRQFLSDSDGKIYKSTSAKVKKATVYKEK